MTDRLTDEQIDTLVGRLRQRTIVIVGDVHVGEPPPTMIDDDCKKAAQAIRQLREDLRELKTERILWRTNNTGLRNDKDKLEKRNRELVEKINLLEGDG